MRQQKNEWGMGLGIFATKLKKKLKTHVNYKKIFFQKSEGIENEKWKMKMK